MRKYTTSFLGKDCPGVVAAISRLFSEANCVVEAMSQTMLCGEFNAIYIVAAPDGLELDSLNELLVTGLARANVDLSVLARKATDSKWGTDLDCDPFVITVDGASCPELIGAMSRVFARHNVNIENLTALPDAEKTGQTLVVFEVMAPKSVDTGRLRRELELEAQKLNLQVSVQHRDIFEAVNRVNSF